MGVSTSSELSIKCPRNIGLLCLQVTWLAVCLRWQICTPCVVDPSLTSHFCMALAERFPSLHEKTFALQVFLAKSAVKALTVIVVVEGLDPSVSGFNGKSARNTLCREQLVPVFFTVWKPVLKVEWWIGKYFATISTNKTLRVECLPHRLQTVLC